jgi:hypothetical protein
LGLADCTRLITMAARCPANSLPTNIHALRLCASAHNRNNWLFTGSLGTVQGAVAVMSLVHFARMILIVGHWFGFSSSFAGKAKL